MNNDKNLAQKPDHLIAQGVDDEPVESNLRLFKGRSYQIVTLIAVVYAAFHMLALNGIGIKAMTGGLVDIPFLPDFPIETWNFRIAHVAGALILGFLMFSATGFADGQKPSSRAIRVAAYPLLICGLFSLGMAFYFAWEIASGSNWNGINKNIRFNEIWLYGAPLWGATGGSIILSWFDKQSRGRFAPHDFVLVVSTLAVAVYLITIYGTQMRNSTGTAFAPVGISMAAVAGTALIMELTRRVAGMALVVIATVFLIYVFIGEFLPSFLNSPAITWERFFSQVYTDAGVLGPTTAVSSTYIILFIIFAAFLQASKVGDYFVNFAFAIAGKARGGPAKVAIFASGLMGMINGTSAGNVVATGSLTKLLHRQVVKLCRQLWVPVHSLWLK